MGNRYSNYLPDTVAELQEFQKLGEIEGVILEEEAAAKEKLVQNQWILTAERSGLLRLAKIMGLSGAETMETEALRGEILYHWNSRSPYTQFHLMDWLDGFLGKNQYQLQMQEEQYTLQLTMGLRVKEKKDFLVKHLRKIIPANLVLEVDLNANTHADLKVMTHGQMKELGWVYGQILLEDLTPYKE